MSRKNIILIGYLFIILGYIVLSSRSGGVGNILSIDATGSPVATHVCGSCHGDNNNFSSTVSMQILDGGTPVTSYTPGQTYTMTLQVSGTAPHYGGQAVALKLDNTAAGSLGVPSSPNTQVTVLNNIDYLEHNSRSSTGTFTTTWTAPLTGSGNVNIHYIGNAVNGSGTGGDDPTAAMTMTLTEAVIETCSDGIQNQDETGIDCGGAFCEPCVCVAIPTNHSVIMTSPTTAFFDWDDMAGADFYQVWYRDKGPTNEFSIASSTISQKSLNVFQNKKFYQYKVRSRCTDGVWSDFTEVITWYSSQCDVPTGVAATAFNNTTMRVRWDSNPAEIKGKVRYRQQGTSTWFTKNSADGNNVIFVPDFPANAIVQYKVRSNCDGNDWSAYSSPLMTIDLSTAARESQVATETRIYPNPAKDVLNLEFETITAGDVKLVITDMTGKQLMIQNNTYAEGNNRESLDVSSLSSGYYFLTIYSGDDVNTMKFVRL